MAVDTTQLQPDLSRSKVDFNNLGLSGESYVPPGGGPQITDQPATNQVSPDTTVELDAPTIANPGQSNTGLGSSLSAPRVGMSYGEFTSPSASSAPKNFAPRAGMSYGDYQNALQGIPRPVPPQPSQNQAGNQQFGNDWMGGILNWEQQNLPGPIRGFVHGATEQVLPTIAAIGAGGIASKIATSVATDALIGTAFDELGPWGTIIGGIVGLGSAIAGGALASSGQSAAMKQIMPAQDLSAYEAQRQYEGANYPISEALGGLAPQLMFFRENPDGLKNAAKLIGQVFATKGKPGAIMQAFKDNPDGLQNLLFAAYGSTNALREAQTQIQQGNLQPATLAINLVGGVLFSKPRSWGAHTTDPTTRDNAIAGRREMMSHVADAYKAQIEEDPANADLYNSLADLYTAYGSQGPESDTSGTEALIKKKQQELEQRQSMAPSQGVVENKTERIAGGAGNPDVRVLAQQYAQGAGLPVPQEGERVKVDPAKATRLAQFYEGAQSNPNDPEVQAAYQQFNAETEAQWNAALAAGFRLEPWTKEGQPYANSAEMMNDVRNNKHLYYFTTDQGQLPHELMTPEQNDRFRAVHDLFGHAMAGNQFGQHGEENAWVEHSKMYSPLAQRAMTTETRAQNSTVNYGSNGEFNRANPTKTIYPDQKALIVPDEFLPEGNRGAYLQQRTAMAQAKTQEITNRMFQEDRDFQRQNLQEAAPQLLRAITEKGGFTYDPKTSVQPDKGFAVSIDGHQEVFDPSQVTEQTITDYARRHADTLSLPGNHLGGWMGSDGVYLDVSQVAKSKQAALKIAGDSQQAITNLTTGRDIPNPNYNPNQLVLSGAFKKSEPVRMADESAAAFALRKAAAAYGEFLPGDRVTSPSGNTGVVLGKGKTSSKQFQGTGLYQVRWDNGVTTSINGDKLNGIQPKATGGAEQGGFGSEANQASLPEEDSQTGQVGNQGFIAKAGVQDTRGGQISPQEGQLGISPDRNGATAGAVRPSTIGTGDLYSNAGPAGGSNATTLTANGTAANVGSPDYSATTYAAWNSKTALGGTRNVELPPTSRSAGWSTTADLVAQTQSRAKEFGVDISQVPQIQGASLLPEHLQELEKFAAAPNTNTKKVYYDRSILAIPDHPRFIPDLPKGAKKWEILDTANELTQRLQAQGFPVRGLLIGPLDDPTRIALYAKGIDGKDFYVHAQEFPGTLDFSTSLPGAEARWRAGQVAFGDGNSVPDNARALILHHSRLESGVYADPATGLLFDPNRRNQLIDHGVIMLEGGQPFSDESLVRASLGLMPESIKLGDYGGAQAGEARGPIDRHLGRAGRGIDNPSVTTKVYDYEEGRLRWITQMIAAYDPTILPSHVQAGIWKGFLMESNERIAELKIAADASGDPYLKGLANSMRADLEGKDLAEMFREGYGLVQDSQPPILPYDREILSNRKLADQLDFLSGQYVSRRFVKGEILGRKSDKEDIQTQESAIESLLKTSQYNELYNKLADYYLEHYVNASEGQGVGNLRLNLRQTLGWGAEKVAQVAYRMKYPLESNMAARNILDTLMPGSGDSLKSPLGVTPKVAVEQHLPQIMKDLESLFNLPSGYLSGKVGLEHKPRVDYIAKYDWKSGEVRINTAKIGYGSVIATTDASLLKSALPVSQARGKSRILLEKLLADAQSGDDVSVLRYVLAHEVTHLLQDRQWGGTMKLLDSKNDAQKIPLVNAILDRMTPQYMLGLLREGLGNELEALVFARAKALGREEDLSTLLRGGKGEARITGQKMPLGDAIYNIMEHQAYQYPASKGVQHSGVSLTTDEVTRRNIHEPEIAGASQKAFGQIFDSGTREIAKSLALEADARSGGRGPNPSVDPSVLDLDAARGGYAAYAKFPYRTVQSNTSGWGDAASSDSSLTDRQISLRERVMSLQSAADVIQSKMDMPNYKPDPSDQETLGFLQAKIAGLQRSIEDPEGVFDAQHVEAAFKKAVQVTQPDLRTSTVTASRLQRKPDEPIKQYAARMAEGTGLYKNLDHALGILKASQDGIWTPVTGQAGKAGFMMAGKFHEGTPSEHVTNWGNKFGGVMRDALSNLDQEQALALEPAPQGPTGLDNQELIRSVTEPPVRSTAATAKGVVSVVDKTGNKIEPASMPTMSKDVIKLKGVGKMPKSENLNPKTQANVTEAAHDNFETTLESQEAMKDQGIFDPVEAEEIAAIAAEKDIAKNQIAQSTRAGSVPTPSPRKITGPTPPKGVTGEARREAVRAQEKANSKLALQGFLDSLMKVHGVGDPELSRVASTLNDAVSGTLRTWDINEYRKDPRTWSDDTVNTVKGTALAYERGGALMDRYISNLPATEGETANDRIRRAIDVTNPEERKAALQALSPQERAIADLFHNYWQFMGDTGRRGGVLDSYLENYLPHIVKPPKGKQVYSANGTLSADLRYAIDRIEKGDGSLVFQKVEDLERYLQNPKRANLQGYTVEKDLGKIFSAHGKAISQSLIMKSAVDRLSEVETPIAGIPLRPVATSTYLADKPIKTSENYREVKIGPWARVLSGNGLEAPLKVWNPLAAQMERAASVYEMEGGKFVGLAKKINTANAWFKQYKFVSPVHIYSLLSNLSSIKGVTQLPAVLHAGRDIVEGEDFKRHAELVSAGLPDFNGPIPDKFWIKAGGLKLAPKKLGEAEGGVPENMAGVSGILQNLPGPAGAFFRAQHDLTWRQTGYYGLVGLSDKLSKEYLADWSSRNPEEPITAQMRRDADKQAVYQAKKALGYLTNMDMSKDWDLFGNTLFLANRWTMSQLRSLGDAFSIGPLKGIGALSRFGGGGAPAIETGGKFADYLQRKNAYMAQKLIWGGMARLLMTTFVTSTALSSILNNGVPSTPFQNFQKDPAHAFDIYAGRDPNTNRDQWVRTPFFLFQREMTDWALSGVKALQEGHPLVDPNNLGYSALFAPFERFATKMNPISRLSFEMMTGTELNLWMKGYAPDKMMIDNDKYITNINKSLQAMGVPDMGSLENRFLYAFRELSPTPGTVFPTDLNKATADPGAVASALGFGTFNPFSGDNLKTMALGAGGTREDPGMMFVPGQEGQMQPAFQVVNAAKQKDALGQQILQIASTLGASTPQEEVQKLQQIEQLREQAGYSPGQLSQLLLFGASHTTGAQGLLYQNAPNTPKTTTTKVLNGTTLSPQQQVLYNEVSSQRQMFAVAQLINSPDWATMDVGSRTSEANSMVQFADKITNEQMGQLIGTKKGIPISNSQANSMIVEFGIVKRQAQADLMNSPYFKAATPGVQQTMMADRITATQNALWAKYFGVLKGASDQQVLQYVDLQTGLRDEVRNVLGATQTYVGADPATQNALLSKNLAFADNLVNQMIQGKSPRTFNSPMTQSQLYMAVRNGVVLQDVAVRNLQGTQMYQDALAADTANGTSTASTLENKYITLAHNIALYDTRVGVNVNNAQPLAGGFNAALNTQLQADEGYHSLIQYFFGQNGSATLTQYDTDLANLKAQYRQENSIPPAYLSRVDAQIEHWFYSQHPDYYAFVEARKNWEKYDPTGIAYKATTQSNLGFETAIGR